MLTHSKPRHFRLQQPQGLKESWLVQGHWIIYSDQGNPNHIAFVELASFTTQFVSDLEEHAASFELSDPENTPNKVNVQ